MVIQEYPMCFPIAASATGARSWKTHGQTGKDTCNKKIAKAISPKDANKPSSVMWISGLTTSIHEWSSDRQRSSEQQIPLWLVQDVKQFPCTGAGFTEHDILAIALNKPTSSSLSELSVWLLFWLVILGCMVTPIQWEMPGPWNGSHALLLLHRSTQDFHIEWRHDLR